VAFAVADISASTVAVAIKSFLMACSCSETLGWRFAANARGFVPMARIGSAAAEPPLWLAKGSASVKALTNLL
jgi:hypothetical protein